MLFLTGLFFLAMAAMAGAPETPFGKSLRAFLVERPARMISTLSPAKIVIGTIVAVLLIAMAMSAPEIIAMIGFGDLAVYLDAAVIVSLVAAATRLKFVVRHAMRLGRDLSMHPIRGMRRYSARGRRIRRPRGKLPPASDETGPLSGLAFA